MNLILQLDAEIELRLTEQAAASGKAPEVIALEALNEKLLRGDTSFRPQSSLEWCARLTSLLDSAPTTGGQSVDDRRESIYAQRGE